MLYRFRYVLIAALGFLMLGNILSWIACMKTSFVTLVFGDALFWYDLLLILFSIGGQCYLVVIGTLEAFWFRNKETSVALALDSSVNFLAVAVVYWTVPHLFEVTNSLAWPFFLSMMIAGFSLVCGVFLFFLDKKAVPDVTVEDTTPALGCGTVKSLGKGVFFLIGAFCTRSLGTNLFEFISSGFFQDRFGFTEEEAGRIISIPYISFFLLTTLVGYLLYRLGNKPIFRI